MKKGFILFTALFLISTFTAFAAVKAVKEGDVVKVTWTYENADAASVGLVGDFQGWNLAGALPMTKDASGVWTITLDGKADSEYLYKFNVDGEWTEDPAAPGTFDDGFGGLNGKVVVADLLTEAVAAGAAPAGPRLGLAFATYTQIGFNTDFITKDIKTGSVDGLAVDKVGVTAKSYWKFAGDFLPGNRLDIEIAAIDNGSLVLYQKNTNGADTAFVTPADGLNNLGDFLFNPFTSLAKQQPYLGHFKYTLKTPVVKILQAYHYAKSTLREGNYVYSLVSESDSGDGTIEISASEPIDLGGITLAPTVAFSKRTTNYGSFGWLDMNFGKGLDASITYGSITNESHLFNYFNNAKNIVDLGFAGKFGDLNLTVEGLMNFWTKDSGVKTIDALAAALKAKYTMGDNSIAFTGSYAGDGVDMVYGNDDNLNKGKIFVELAPAFKIDALDLGLTVNATLDNMTSENAKKPELVTYAKPSIGYTMGDLYFGLFAKVNYNQIKEETDSTTPFAFKFGEVDAKFSMNNLGPGKLISQLAFVNNAGDYDAVKDVYKDNGFDVSLINAYEMADQLTFYVSGIYRAKGADETDADYKKESVFGASLGVNKVLIDSTLKNPQLFFLFDYNMNPWSGDYKTNLDQEDGNYRWDDLNAGKGKATARVGAVWSF